MTKEEPLIQVKQLSKTYRMGREVLQVLRQADLRVPAGEWLCILGASGSGKSTLLHVMGGLDRPDSGEVVFRGQNLFSHSEGERDRFRNRHVGFVFQFYHLLPELDVLENTLIASLIGSDLKQWAGRRQEAHDRACQLLEKLGLGERLHHRPSELSGGERQRVALARGLINRPDVLLADEPTGNLDRKTGGKILDVLGDLHREGQTIVMVTHDPVVAGRADRVLRLEGGLLQPEAV